MYKNPNLKPLDREAVKLLIVHCVANKCNRPFEPENLINCGIAKYGQPSYYQKKMIITSQPRILILCD